MTYMYSPSTKGFYRLDVHKSIPKDAFIVSEEKYNELFDAQKNGKQIAYDDANGLHSRSFPIDIERVKKNLHSVVESLRDTSLSNGVEYNGNMYQADSVSCGNMTSMVSAVKAGVPIPEGFTWRTTDNKNIDMDEEGICELASVALLFVNACYRRSWELKAQIDAELANIDPNDENADELVAEIKNSIFW